MAEYIERAVANGWLMDMFYSQDDEGCKELVERFNKAIPAADVVPVRHGRWLTKEYRYGDPDVGIEDMWIDRLAEEADYYAHCSICGKDAEYNAEESLILSDYCPNCGARMDLKDGDGDV